MFSQMSQDDTVKDMMQNDSSKNANQTQYFSFKTFIELKQYLCDKKKRVWQVTTIIQLAMCHLVTSHFQEIACNYTPKGQIRWPIFLLLLCMIVLTEITSKFPKPIIFRILVFSCHKMTLITIITRMPLTEGWNWTGHFNSYDVVSDSVHKACPLCQQNSDASQDASKDSIDSLN